MNSENSLKSILESLHFSEYEQQAFQKATAIARDYMKNGDIDLEKQFREIVEEVADHEVQEN